MKTSKAINTLLVCITVTCSFAANIKKRGTSDPVDCGRHSCYHGTCERYSDGHHYCTCEHGWNGQACAHDDTTFYGNGPCYHNCQYGKCDRRSQHEYIRCICLPGWSGTYCDVKDSCGGLHCNHGTCHLNSDHHHYCTCEDGWTGRSCDQEYCGSRHCDHGQCHINSDGHHSCTCELGWTGRDCDEVVHITDNCGVTHCGIHGVCTYDENYNEKNCVCDAGWTNLHCNTKVMCGSQHCVHGHCQHHSCSCESGWTGRACDQVMCGSQHCVHGHCQHHSCSCISGWTGRACDQAHKVTTTTSTTTASTTTAKARPTTKSTTTMGTTASTTTTKPSTRAPVTTTTTATTTTPATTKPATIALATATSSSQSTTSVPSTVVPYHYYQCGKLSIIYDIAIQNVATNMNTSMCVDTGDHSSPEAFVLNHCNTALPPQWNQGKRVMADCNAIPKYTPIATFESGIYLSAGGLTGVFVGCLPNGFKISIQHCGQVPTIEHIEQGGIYTYNPDVYYTIQ